MAWYDNPITGNYTPSVGMYDTSIGLPVGTTITSPVNGIVVGGSYDPSGIYAAFGRQDWGGEVDILTNLAGYGQTVIVDLLHFDTINVVPGQQVSAGQVLGTSGGQTSGGNWPSLPKYSTGPHIGVGVRSATGFLPAWDASSLISNLRAGLVSSSAPAGFGTGAQGSSAPADVVGAGLLGGLGTSLVSGLSGNTAKLVSAVESDLLGFSIRGGLVLFGALLILLGFAIFFFSRPGVEETEQAGATQAATAALAAA